MRRFFIILTLPAVLAAHEMVVRVEPGPSAVVLRAAYGWDEPAGRADVEIFKPGDADSPYQTGSTDASGAFAFVPSEPGKWMVVVDDGYGHRAETSVEWASGPVSSPAPQGGGENWKNALTGVSLLIGLTGIWLWLQSRNATKPS
jgi:nickel transport protein